MNVLGLSGLDGSVAAKQKEFPHLDPRMYRNAQGFDSAAALVTDAGVAAAAAQERFNRRKACGEFPLDAARYCLRRSRISLDEVDFVAHGFAYDALRDRMVAAGHASADRFDAVYSSLALANKLREFFPGSNLGKKLTCVPHHLAHAASCFYLSGFDNALILVSDGSGERQSATVYLGQGNKIRMLREISVDDSLGLLYAVFTHYLGFSLFLDEFKVMGLASYGDPRTYRQAFSDIVRLQDDGGYAVSLLSANRSPEQRESFSESLKSLAEIFGPPRLPGAAIEPRHQDIARGLQDSLERALIHILSHYKKETGAENLCLSGGVALNCRANAAIKQALHVSGMFIQPAAGDDGTALGAALYARAQHMPSGHFGRMSMPYWGPSFRAERIARALRQHGGLRFRRLRSGEAVATEAARRIAGGQIVAWFQGGMEFGPRALGHRSILGDPRDARVRDRLNAAVKGRDSFLPFAPAVISEKASTYFHVAPGDEHEYAHMLLVARVRAEWTGRLAAVTHVDDSARVQIVSRAANPRFWNVIRRFGSISGVPILLNTSLNLSGEPIVCTPEDAVSTFLRGRLDALVIGNFLAVARGRGEI
ncbi:MAG: carbamoyltransferase C-terminal domain-containing protein [Elusimicrobiota bacterium]